MCGPGNQSILTNVCVKLWAAGGREGGREDVRGEKVLQLNYIVCGEETRADRQMAQMLWGNGSWVGRVGGGLQCSQGTKGDKGTSYMFQFDVYVLFFDVTVTNYCIKDLLYEPGMA